MKEFETLEEAQEAYDELYEDHMKLLTECSDGVAKAFEMVKCFGEAANIIGKRKPDDS